MNYYNEFDPKAAAWLRELIAAGLIPAGIVDTRSITEIQPHELKDFTQCHFFAGIAGWSLALQLAGWPSTRPVWTGSCPCQPFSSAGKQLAQADARHLWPVFFNLIRECRPECVFGEQVASAIGKGWLDGVSSDLERAGYACGATVLGAHSIGAPHIRQRLYWVADALDLRRIERRGSAPAALQGAGAKRSRKHTRPEHVGELSRRLEGLGSSSGSSRLADAGSLRCNAGLTGDGRGEESTRGEYREGVDRRGGMGHALDPRLEGHAGHGDDGDQPGRDGTDVAGPIAETSGLVPANGRGLPANTSGLPNASGDMGGGGQHEPEREPQGRASNRGTDAWSRFDLIPCADGKARRIEPGLAPLAHGVPARVVRLRGYGNAIVPQVAAEFVGAFLDTQHWRN